MDSFAFAMTYIVFPIVILYLYLSVFVFFYAAYVDRDLELEPIFGIKIFNIYFFAIGCMIGLTAFFAPGFERALFFIPENWGGIDEYGDWRPVKEGLSYSLAAILSIALMVKSNNLFTRKEKSIPTLTCILCS